MNNIIRTVKREITRLEEIKQKIDVFLANAPKGSLKYQIRNENTYYYHQQVISNSTVSKNETSSEYIKKEYIKKKDISLAKSLAQKNYYVSVRPIVEKNLKELKHLINNYQQKELEKIYSSLPIPRKQLVIPIQTSIEEKHKQWMEETYEQNNMYPENLRYETDQGEMVRSKSEVIIANILHKNRKDILYKYERLLKVMVNGVLKTIYPDFTIFNLHTGEITYWEHAGRMDDPYYANEFVKKMNIYTANNLVLGKDILLTFESQMHPLDTGVVRKMIKAFI